MKQIVVIAHDKMKPELVNFFKEREGWLWGKELIATGKTADAVEAEIKGIPVKHLSRGRYGGYNQITEMIENKSVDMVIFFRDPEVKEHHEDIATLLTACNRMNIPLATNSASAELLIIGRIKVEASEKLKSRNEN
jgi:methylglyoxal synthase